MKKLWHVLLITHLLAVTNIAAASSNSSAELKVVPELDLNKYIGLWYEIARLPNGFQKMCVGDVTARYELLEDGSISVINSCVESDGTTRTAEGTARLANSDGPTSKLEVRFAPAFLSFLPFVWGDYWVIDLAPDYSYSVVGHPDRTYLWILSRTPQMEDSTYQQILESIEKLGYDPSELVKTPQDGAQNTGSASQASL